MNRNRALAAGALLAGAVTSYASPWWALHRMQAAVAARDAGAVAAQVDFPALRASVKGQLAGAMGRDVGQGAGQAGGDNPFAAAGRALALALVDPLVDAIVSPAGVSAMVEHGRIALSRPDGAPAAEQERKRVDYAVAYRGWDRFAVMPKDPDGGSFIFRRDGLWSWKLAGIELPAAR